MADIAQAAGVGKGTLYRRFTSKAELCLGLMDEQMTTFQNQMLAQFRQMTAGSVPYMTQLEFFWMPWSGSRKFTRRCCVKSSEPG